MIGICSKRYALYNKEGDNFSFYEHERSYKLYGLGHLTNPFPMMKKTGMLIYGWIFYVYITD